jgi:glucose-6-phosphate 1-dehydrogenase
MKTKLLIFGITGDLSTRKLLPALSKIITTDDTLSMEIIGVSRRQVDVIDLLQSSTGSDALADRITIVSMDLARADDYVMLKNKIALQDNEQLLIYLSVPPGAATHIVDLLGEAGINTSRTKLLFEKPFGMDSISATEMIERTARYFNEDQIYRIDHYLAKAMTQNIVAFRAGNAMFSHLWHKGAIEKIEVMALEQIDIEGRVQFYEQTGALRDLVQGHLMQLLALVLMDIPDELDWNDLPARRLAALNQLLPANPALVTRAQYEGYQQAVANPGSQTETFVSVTLASRDPQWQGVPLVLTTGKALAQKTTEIRVHFSKHHHAQSNLLTLRIQPNEGIEIELFTKKPGYTLDFETQTLAFNYPATVVLPDAYEQVIVDAIRSKKSLFTSSDEVLASWRIVHPIQAAWAMQTGPLHTYSRGSLPSDLL